MKYYNVELLDEYLFLQEGANDHQIRAVIEFHGSLDIGRLESSIRESFKYIPILSSRLVRKGRWLRWEEADPDGFGGRFVELIEGEPASSRLINMLEKQADQYAGPQLKAAVFRYGGKDTLILTVNHMVLDGSGFKKYLALLSGLYGNDPADKNKISRERNIYKVIDGLKFKSGGRKDKSKASIPAKLLVNGHTGRETALFIHKVCGGDFTEIRKFCREKNITVNDYMTAVFTAALFDAGFFHLNKLQYIDMMIDARRYDVKNLLSPFANASSMEKVKILCESRDSDKLLENIHGEIEKIKQNMPGYRNLKNLKSAGTFLPKPVYFMILKNIIRKPGFSVTNIGQIDGKEIRFDGSEIENAYFVTALKKNGSVQFSFSSFGDILTISTFGCYSAAGIKNISEIYDCIEKNCKSFIERR